MSGNNGMLLVLAAAAILLVGGGVLMFGGLMDDPSNDPGLEIPLKTEVESPAPKVRHGVGAAGQAHERITPREFKATDDVGQTAPASTRRTGIELRGLIRGSNGKALAGAEVALYADRSAIRTRPQQGRLVAKLVTTPSGQFQIEDLIADERYVLRVSHPHHATASRHPIDPLDRKTLYQEVRLETGLGFHGTVTDKDQLPLEGAKVYVYDQNVQAMDPEDQVERVVVAAADGSYRVENLSPGIKRVVARKPGFSSDGRPSLRLLKETAAEDKAVDLVLNQGFKISGTVTDAKTGEAIANAIITARPMSALRRSVARPANPGEMDAGRDLLKRQEMERQRKRRLEQRPGVMGEPLRATPTGRRVNGMNLAQKAFLIETARSDEQGAFSLDGLLEARYRLVVRCRGYQNHPGIQANAGDAEIKLSLTPSARISGVVLDKATGEPIPWFSVGASPSGELSYIPAQVRQRFSDEKGRFTFLDVRPGKTHLYAEAEGHAMGRTDQLTVESGQSLDGVVIELPVGATLRGRVTAAGGGPVAGARVSLQDAKGALTGAAAMFITIIQKQVRGSGRYAFTDASGIWEIKHVAHGRYKVEATHSDYSEGSSEEVSCEDEGEVPIPDIVLRPGGIIRGVVRAKDGTPETQAVVMVSSTDPQKNFFNRSVQSNSRGEFEVTGLRSGSYRVFVSQRNGAFDLMNVLKAQQNQNIVHVSEGKVSEVEL